MCNCLVGVCVELCGVRMGADVMNVTLQGVLIDFLLQLLY
jgi:hypothetical protein